MEATPPSSASPLWGGWSFRGISRPTRLVLGMLSILAAVYVIARNRDGEIFSNGALKTAQKITASALGGFAVIFTISVVILSGLVLVPIIFPFRPPRAAPFDYLLPSHVSQQIKDSRLLFNFVCNGGLYTNRSSAKDFAPIAIFDHSRSSGFTLQLEIRNHGLLYQGHTCLQVLKKGKGWEGSFLGAPDRFKKILLCSTFDSESSVLETDASQIMVLRDLSSEISPPLDSVVLHLLKGGKCRLIEQTKRAHRNWDFCLAKQASFESQHEGLGICFTESPPPLAAETPFV